MHPLPTLRSQLQTHGEGSFPGQCFPRAQLATGGRSSGRLEVVVGLRHALSSAALAGSAATAVFGFLFLPFQKLKDGVGWGGGGRWKLAKGREWSREMLNRQSTI